MRRLLFVCLAFAIACSRETPAPPSTDSTPTTATTTPPQATTTTRMPVLQKGTYDEALLWFRSAKKFHFILDDGGVHAEGDVTRSTPGAEKVRFRANGTEWLAEATAQGVTWKRRDGNTWKSADTPEFGPRLYQRVTLPFDPQKKEGVPLLASEEGETNLYRFTNANTGDMHEVWVKKSDGAVERIKIGEKVDLRLIF
ncbi:MAG TPA: hypothetical protein VGQ36_02120 [Thermoanaerobaculia bacterium]|nr:hypothetical protein [Thermoanaerobaculia bacterium]